MWRQAGLVELAQAVLAQQNADGERLELALVDRPLRPNVVQTLGLTLQELAFNARRFGALSTPGGRVRLTSDDGDATELRLVWEEAGGPPVAPPGQRGFGLRVLSRMLGQHSGRCDFDWRAEGLVCRIVMPAAEAAPG
jgi:two-component sensor histidine kinase